MPALKLVEPAIPIGGGVWVARRAMGDAAAAAILDDELAPLLEINLAAHTPSTFTVDTD